MKKRIDCVFRCKHEKMIPLVDLSLGYGSMGSQVGYSCDDCHYEEILWPKGHINYGSEEEIVNLNTKKYESRSTSCYREN